MRITFNVLASVLSVDLRDAVGDRLFLSDGFRRDGTKFDIGQATSLKEHAEALSARQAVSQSRNSRGFFDVLLRRAANRYKPTYNYQPDGSACRVFGTITAKRVTGKSSLSLFCDICVSFQAAGSADWVQNVTYCTPSPKGFTFGSYRKTVAIRACIELCVAL